MPRLRPLDYLVYGLPRSGTSAVAAYLSAVPGVHCGLEVFPTFMDHGALRAPRDFLAHDDPLWRPSSVAEVTARGGGIRVWGNKTPTYFYNLAALYDQLGPVPSLLCLRPLEQVAASYAMRAADPEDSWPRGRGALFAFGDALVLLRALHRLERCDHILAVPQGPLVADWRAVMGQALAHVAPDVPPEFREDELGRIVRRRERSAARPKPPVAEMQQVERDALGKMRQIGATGFFADETIGPVEARRPALEAILQAAPPDPVGWMRRAVERLDDDGAGVAFLEAWTKHVARVTRAPKGGAVG
ncbi:sulfotransferase family protein [Marinibacterium profundimaris]|uniref:Sulfotransferase domain-containing protein n=1 Tax=Marinibacterium profundimaris TaxID=1679460 RepID=A0A225NC01_9RHOB|nr:hypothetical protein [Marinibacterium profundimaris]MAU94914.1 hypothetical protein [Fulvimarina sp.]OWU68386.1 hypothetical protein ATO3_24175 [Marinibacterium profundimaris]